MIPIPFTLPDEGLHERKGTVTIEGSDLVIRIHEQFLGMIHSDHKEVHIDPGALSDAILRRGVFVDRLVIVPERGEQLSEVPGAKLGALELRVWRRHRAALEEIADFVDAAR